MADKNNKINYEKRLIELIRKVFKEEFAKQEKSVSNLISGNFSITKQQIEEVKKEVLDLRKSIEFTENQLEEKVKIAESKLADIEHRIKELYDYQIDPEYVEDRSRRNNLRVDGILETPGETWEDCKEKLQQVFQEKFDLECPVEIERAHRMSSRQNNTNNGNNPRTIIYNLLRYKDKVKILQKGNKLKGTNIFINEDFSRETMELRKQLWKEIKAYRDKGRVVYLSYRTVVVKKGGNFAK